MKKVVLAIGIIGVVLFSCTDRDDELLNANIRIQNRSTLNFDMVSVIADSLFYENVPIEGFSAYLPFETAFRNMPFTITTDSTTFEFTPSMQDTVPLPVGLYTYEVSINAEGTVELNFKID